MRRPFSFRSLFRRGTGPLVLAAAAALAGCAHSGVYDPVRAGPFFTPTNFRGEASTAGIRRVVVLPAWVADSTPSEAAAALDEVFVKALQQENRFEVVTFSREECRRRYRVDALSSSGALPHDLLPMLRREFAADAVLFIDLTSYSAYRPLILGLRGKLASLDGTRLIWTFDNVFSAEDPATANSARRHFLKRNGDVPADMTGSVLQSPARFATYAAAAMFATLPPVVPPPPVLAK